MTHFEIKGALIAKGYTIKSIADELGVTGSAVTQVIRGFKSRRIRIAIAKRLGKDVCDIWPEEEPMNENDPASGRNTGVAGGTVDTVPEAGRLLQGNVEG